MIILQRHGSQVIARVNTYNDTSTGFTIDQSGAAAILRLGGNNKWVQFKDAAGAWVNGIKLNASDLIEFGQNLAASVIISTTQPLRLGYSVTKYVNFVITSGGVLQITPDAGNGVQLTQGNNWGPIANNGVDLGSSGTRWSNIYAGNGVTTPLVTVSSTIIFTSVGTKIKRDVDNSSLAIRGSTDVGGGGAYISLFGKSDATHPGKFFINTPNAAGNADVTRLEITGVLATAVATWSSVTHTGLSLSSALTTGAQKIGPDATNSFLYFSGGIAYLNSIGDMIFAIDTDNSVADTGVWVWYKNAVDAGGTQVMTLTEAGLLTLTGAVRMPNNIDIQMKNAASAYLSVLYVSTGDIVRLAGSGSPVQVGTTAYATLPAGSIGTNGGLMIGSNTLNSLFDDAANGGGSTSMFIGTGQIQVASDIRIKKDIHQFVGSALTILRQARIKQFVYDDPADNGNPWGKYSRGQYIGLIAQDVIKWAPWAINASAGINCNKCRNGDTCREHTLWLAEWEHLVPLTIKGIQELDERVAILEKKVT